MVFYILFFKSCNILCDLITSLLLLLKANIYLVLILLLLFTIGFFLFFLYMKKLPPIKLWVLLSILLLPIIISFFNFPVKFYMGSSSSYTIEQQSIIFNSIYFCKGFLSFGIIGISYFHYLRKKKQLN